jgi:FAD synthase
LLKENVNALIGKYMAMDFVQRIRSQHKFKTPEELSKQIAKDCEEAKEILTAQGSLPYGAGSDGLATT